MSFCIKCGEEAIVVPRLNDGFCRKCFLNYAIHKFRASIGKSKLVRDDERVLVAYSTGAASTCLLHLIQEGVSRRAQKRLRFHSTIAFIDESSILGVSSDDRCTIVDRAVSAMRQSQLPAVFAHLEESLKLATNDQSGRSTTQLATNDQSGHSTTQLGTDIDEHFDASTFVPPDDDTRNLMSLMTSAQSLSAKEDLLRILRYRLLVALAKRTGCTKVATADCSSRMAVTFLSDLARGRGAHVSFNMGFSDSRIEDVQFFRPLKDFTSKEVAFYNRLNDLDPRTTPTITTKGDTKVSIERLTQDFINNLQADYSSTIPNIVRTGEKLEVSAARDVCAPSSCSMCLCPLDTHVPPASALHSVEVSTNLGYTPRESTTTPQGLSHTPNLSSLCYGCRVLASDMDDFSSFPSQFVTSQARESIQDYLLTDQSYDM